jgi:GTPase SAR1 family protein
MIVYDVNERNSFENVKRWITEVRSLTEPDTVLILVGNKIDLCENDPSMRKVPKAEAEKFSNENGVLFVESSAEACNNVRESFEVLLQKIYSNSKENKDNGISLVDANMNVNGAQQKPCC